MDPPETPEWPTEIPPIDDKPPTEDQRLAAAQVIQELSYIPHECGLRLNSQREDMLNWGTKVAQVEQKRCDIRVTDAQHQAEGFPLWGVLLGIAGGATASFVVGFIIGFTSGVK